MSFEDLVDHESMFGWILSGSCLKGHEESVSHQFLCIITVNHVNESDLHNFWNLESVSIYAEKDSPPRDPVLDTFEQTVKYVDGRYEVALPCRLVFNAQIRMFINFCGNVEIWCV